MKKAIRNLGRGTAVVLRSRGEPSIVRFDVVSAPKRDMDFEISSMAREPVGKSELRAQLMGMGFAEDAIDKKLAQMFCDRELSSYEVKEGKYSGTWCVASPRNSAEHDVMLQIMSKLLKERGIANKICDSAYMPDIVAFNSGGKTAIEYETGKKNPADTEKMLQSRKEKYRKVIVVVNDDEIGRYLQFEGVEIMSASDFLGQG